MNSLKTGAEQNIRKEELQCQVLIAEKTNKRIHEINETNYKK